MPKNIWEGLCCWVLRYWVLIQVISPYSLLFMYLVIVVLRGFLLGSLGILLGIPKKLICSTFILNSFKNCS